MYKTAARRTQPREPAAELRSNSKINAEKELKRLLSDKPEYKILINNLVSIGQSEVETLRAIKKGARSTQVRLAIKEKIKSQDYKEFRSNILRAYDSIEAAARKLDARAEKDGLLAKVKSILAGLSEVAEALGIVKE